MLLVSRTPALVAGFALLVLPAVAAAQAKGPTLPEGTETFKDVVYGTHERHKLDVYVPKTDKPLPVLLWVHGGGWEGGSKDQGVPFLTQLARGYVVASTNYRFSKQAVFPAQIEDVKAAVRFLRANADKYHINTKKVGVGGASAGGHLVALLGTSGGVKELEGKVGNSDQSSTVQAVLDVFGPTDVARLARPSGNPNAVHRLLGGDGVEKKELAKQANPITFVDKADPPVLILHGDKDTLVPLEQSELFRDALTKAGVEVEMVVVKGVGHSALVFNKETNEKATAFFDKHLKK